MSNTIEGLVVPAITPFHEDGSVADELLGPYLKFLEPYADALVICAIYGSGILMSVEQRKRVAEIAVETANGNVRTVVFVGSADTRTAVDLTEHAQAIGADAVSCVPPFYYKQVDEALFQHYKTLVDASDLPVYAYDSPDYAGNQLSLDLLERLQKAGLAGVVTGQSGHGLERIWKLLRVFGGTGLSVISIRDGLALPALMGGAVAFESGVANYFPELASDLLETVRTGDYKLATLLQERMLRLRDISHALGKNIPTLHALVGMRGIPTGVPRRPFFNLDSDELAWLEKEVSGLDFENPLASNG